MRPIWIGETLRQVIATLVMKEAGYQAKVAYGSLQLCAGLEAGIEESTHAVAQRRREQIVPVPEGRAEEESADGIITVEDDTVIDKGEDEVGGIEEVTVPPGWKQVT